MRVALSIMPIDSSTGKPKRPPRPACASASLSLLAAAWLRPAAAAPARRSRAAAARPTQAHDGEHRLPRQQHQHQRGRRRHRHFPDVAGEIVGAERLHRARAGEGAGHQRRSERMLRAGAQARRSGARPPGSRSRRWRRRSDSRCPTARCRPPAPAACRAAPRAARTESGSPPWCRKSRCAAGRARHSRCRTRPARAAA